jgi:hypothetical protein
MAKTTVLTGATDNQIAYEEKLFREMIIAPELAPLMGEGPDSCIQLKTNLEKAQGDTMRFHLIRKLKGPGITAANNELILFNNGSGLSSSFQKGGSIIKRIIRAWPLGNRLLVHITLKGPGVNATNNEALFLHQENGNFSRILQKGYLLPGGGGARIGTFQRVEASARTGHYALLVSLTGSPAATNQMLLRGNVDSGSPSDVDTFSLRAPVPALRKGQLIANGYAGTTRLTSLAFPNNATVDTTSIGRKGLASIVSATGAILLRATFSDRTTRLIRVP